MYQCHRSVNWVVLAQFSPLRSCTLKQRILTLTYRLAFTMLSGELYMPIWALWSSFNPFAISSGELYMPIWTSSCSFIQTPSHQVSWLCPSEPRVVVLIPFNFLFFTYYRSLYYNNAWPITNNNLHVLLHGSVHLATVSCEVKLYTFFVRFRI